MSHDHSAIYRVTKPSRNRMYCTYTSDHPLCGQGLKVKIPPWSRGQEQFPSRLRVKGQGILIFIVTGNEITAIIPRHFPKSED